MLIILLLNYLETLLYIKLFDTQIHEFVLSLYFQIIHVFFLFWGA